MKRPDHRFSRSISLWKASTLRQRGELSSSCVRPWLSSRGDRSRAGSSDASAPRIQAIQYVEGWHTGLLPSVRAPATAEDCRRACMQLRSDLGVIGGRRLYRAAGGWRKTADASADEPPAPAPPADEGRSRCSATGGRAMAATDRASAHEDTSLPEPGDAEFAGIRADLGVSTCGTGSTWASRSPATSGSSSTARYQSRRRGVAHQAPLVASGDEAAQSRRAQHSARRLSAVRALRLLIFWSAPRT
jgi:hypothetical protein